jgi:hypothetical protein
MVNRLYNKIYELIFNGFLAKTLTWHPNNKFEFNNKINSVICLMNKKNS